MAGIWGWPHKVGAARLREKVPSGKTDAPGWPSPWWSKPMRWRTKERGCVRRCHSTSSPIFLWGTLLAFLAPHPLVPSMRREFVAWPWNGSLPQTLLSGMELIHQKPVSTRDALSSHHGFLVSESAVKTQTCTWMGCSRVSPDVCGVCLWEC